MNVVCPKCTSVEARSLSLIFREGLTETLTHMGGVGFGGGSGSMGTGTLGAVSHGRAQTALSKEAAPPTKKHIMGWLLLTVLFGFLFVGSLGDFGLTTIFFAGIAALGVWMARSNRAYNAAEFPALYDRWQQSFMCSRCGAVFPAA